MELSIMFILVVVCLICVIAISKSGGYPHELPQMAAGRKGERKATTRIESVLREDDALFTNVPVSFENQKTELDNVIVNRYGVFIIEVKNYSGRLSGIEDEYEWTKVHISDAGVPYQKTVKNPIAQVKRETFILANFLRNYGVSVWVEGYAMILGACSPVESGYILRDRADIDRAIHTPGKCLLKAETVCSVKKLLSYRKDACCQNG